MSPWWSWAWLHYLERTRCEGGTLHVVGPQQLVTDVLDGYVPEYPARRDGP